MTATNLDLASMPAGRDLPSAAEAIGYLAQLSRTTSWSALCGRAQRFLGTFHLRNRLYLEFMVFRIPLRLFTICTPALCAVLLAPMPTASATRTPHGLYEIGGDAWTNPGISGWRAEIKCSMPNPSDGVYDWTRIDGLVANAVMYQKQIGLSVTLLSSPPAWVTALPGAQTYNSPLGSDPMVLPFDPVVQPKIIAFITALCLHFDNQLDYIVMGGLGYETETYMPLPADIGLTMTIADYTSAWINSSDLFIDTYNQNLKTTPFVIAAGIPFNDPGAAAAITTVINHGLLYPPFGIMQWGLKATSNNGFLINKLIQDNDAGRATGFQLTGASDGSVGGDLQGTLEQALTAGNALGADWIEIYAADAMNPTYAALLATFNALLTPTSDPAPTQQLLNVSTRTQVLGGDGVLIGGFIVTGNVAKLVVLRALGPSLADAGVTGFLTDPTLELYDSTGTLMQQNDNWTSPLPENVVAAGLTPKDPAESLIAATLPPGSYTAVLQGAGGSTGIGLFELYDLDPAHSRVSNLSTRGPAGSGDQAMIGGFIIGGTQPTEILIRAIGPSLTALGVSGALQDPVLELRGSDGVLIAENDNWRDDQEQQIIATTIPPSNDKESAIIATLSPGDYTALVSGAGTSSGIALVEVYDLTSN